jgi:hypothetical protein
MVVLLAVILAFSWGQLPLGDIPGPAAIQGKVFDNVSRGVR